MEPALYFLVKELRMGTRYLYDKSGESRLTYLKNAENFAQ